MIIARKWWYNSELIIDELCIKKFIYNSSFSFCVIIFYKFPVKMCIETINI